MNVARYVAEVSCRKCGEDDIYADLKEEPSLYKVGAACHDCGWDYGIIDRVSRGEVDHLDETWEAAEAAVRRYLE